MSKTTMHVGKWALEKHKLLKDYVVASHGARGRWQKRTLIDLYCGPGVVTIKETGELSDGGVVAAYKKSLKYPKSAFTDVIIGDLNPQYVEACAEKLTALGANVHCLVGTAEETSADISQSKTNYGFTLAYLDPFNIETLPFSVLRNLSSYKTIDFLVHYSLMDVTRNIELDFSKGNKSKFDAFAPGWRDFIDVNQIPLLQARNDFLEYWLTLLKDLGFSDSKKKPLLRAQSTNAPLYRLILLSRHPLAENLWNDVAKSKQTSFDF